MTDSTASWGTMAPGVDRSGDVFVFQLADTTGWQFELVVADIGAVAGQAGHLLDVFVRLLRDDVDRVVVGDDADEPARGVDDGQREQVVVADDVRGLLLVGLGLGPLSGPRAQDIEPRAYANAPIGINFLIGGYAWTRGALATDTAAPVTAAQFTTSSAALGYVRVLDLGGQSAKFDVIVPYSWLSGSAKLDGEPLEREVEAPPEVSTA